MIVGFYKFSFSVTVLPPVNKKRVFIVKTEIDNWLWNIMKKGGKSNIW